MTVKTGVGAVVMVAGGAMSKSYIHSKLKANDSYS